MDVNNERAVFSTISRVAASPGSSQVRSLFRILSVGIPLLSHLWVTSGAQDTQGCEREVGFVHLCASRFTLRGA